MGFNAFLTAEMLLRMFADGLWGAKSYFTEPWNWLSSVLVVLGWVSLAPGMVDLTPIRFLYLLRPLALFPSMQVVLSAVYHSARGLIDIFLLVMLTCFMFAMLAMELWRGVLAAECFYPDVNGDLMPSGQPCALACTGSICSPAYGDSCKPQVFMSGNTTIQIDGVCATGVNPDYGQSSFDNIFASMLATFVLITTEGWTATMYQLWHAWGLKWFVSTLLTIHVYLGAFVILELSAAVVSEQYADALARRDQQVAKRELQAAEVVTLLSLSSRNALAQDAYRGDGEHAEVRLQRLEIEASADGTGVHRRRGSAAAWAFAPRARRCCTLAQILSCPLRTWNATRATGAAMYRRIPPLPLVLRNTIRSVVEHPLFETFAMLAVIGNGIVLGMGYDSMTPEYAGRLAQANYFFVAVFTLELFLRVLAVGMKTFLKSSVNVFDFLIVIASLADVGAGLYYAGRRSAVQSALQSTRAVRLLRVTALWDGLRDVAADLWAAVPHALNTLVVVAIAVLSFAVLGMQLFGGTRYEEAVVAGVLEEVPRANFNSLWFALISVFQVMDNENWNDVLHAHMAVYGPASALFFLMLIAVGNFIFLNLFLAVLVHNFEERAASRKERAKRKGRRRSVAAHVRDHVLRPVRGWLQGVYKHVLQALPCRRQTAPLRQASVDNGATPMVPPARGGPAPSRPPPPRVRVLPPGAGREAEPDLPGPPLPPVSATSNALRVMRAAAASHRLLRGEKGFSNSVDGSSRRISAANMKPGAETEMSSRLASLVEQNASGAEVTMHVQQGGQPSSITATLMSAAAVDGGTPVGNSKSTGASAAFGARALRITVTRLGEVRVQPLDVIEDVDEEGADIIDAAPTKMGASTPRQAVAASPSDQPGLERAGMSSPSDPQSSATGLRRHLLVARPLPGGASFRRRNTLAEGATTPRSRTPSTTEGRVGRRMSVAITGPQPAAPVSFLKRMREWCWKLSFNVWVERILLVLIIVSSVNLALEEPHVATCGNVPVGEPGSCRRLWTYLRGAEIVINISFLLELFMKLGAFGPSFLRDGWNALDLAVVVVSVAAMVTPPGASSRILQAVRALRAVRPLRLVAQFPSLRLVLNSLLLSLPRMRNVLFMLFLVAYIFAVTGNQNFMGVMWYCNDPDTPTEEACVGTFNVTGSLCAFQPTPLLQQHCEEAGPAGMPFPRVWAPRNQNFDNIARAMQTVFELATGENWPVFMTFAMDGVGYHLPQQRDATPSAAFYYMLIELIMNMFLIELSVGIIVDTYNRLRDEAAGATLLTPAQKIWVHNMRMLLTLKPEYVPKPPSQKRKTCWQTMRRWSYAVVRHPAFEFVAIVIMLVNVAAAASVHVSQSSSWRDAQVSLGVITTVLYGVELLTRLMGYGFRQFVRSPMHWFDIIMTVCSTISVAIPAGVAGNVLRFLRTLRIVRLIRLSKRLQRLLRMLILCVPAFFNIMCIVALNFFVFAIIGMNAFSGVRYAAAQALSEDANFDTFALSLMTLIRACTGENFNLMMHDLEITPPYCVAGGPDANCGPATWLTATYWVIFFTVTTFILMNMITAVLLEAHDSISDRSELVDGTYRVTHRDSELYAALWATHDRANTMKLQLEHIISVVARLPYPLGAKNSPGARRRALHLRVGTAGYPGSPAVRSQLGAMVPRGANEEATAPTPVALLSGHAALRAQAQFLMQQREARATGAAQQQAPQRGGPLSTAQLMQRAERIEAERILRRLPLVPDDGGCLHFHAVLEALLMQASKAPPLGARTLAVALARGPQPLADRDPAPIHPLNEVHAAQQVIAAWRAHVLRKRIAARRQRRRAVILHAAELSAAAAAATAAAAAAAAAAVSAAGGGTTGARPRSIRQPLRPLTSVRPSPGAPSAKR